MRMLLQDLRYAFRSFVKSPAVSVVGEVLSLALGIGADEHRHSGSSRPFASAPCRIRTPTVSWRWARELGEGVRLRTVLGTITRHTAAGKRTSGRSGPWRRAH